MACLECRGNPELFTGAHAPRMKHVWTGQQMGGHPADASSTEWVAYCDNCGVEADGDNEDGECEPAEDDESIVAPILPPYEG